MLKLHFKKVFDHVHWSFVHHVLERMGFSRRWRSWISGCFEPAKMSIIINDSPTKPFHMEWGLWQRDPFSPFVFVFVVEVLNRLITRAEGVGLIGALEIGRDGVRL